MFKDILKFPILYEISQKIFLADNFRKKILKELVKDKSLNILDIGCGPGNMIKYLNFNKYYGFDTDARYIEYAKKISKNVIFFVKYFLCHLLKKLAR